MKKIPINTRIPETKAFMVNVVKEPFNINVYNIPTFPAIVGTLLNCIVLASAGAMI